jgi:hypothetical protein
MLDCADRPDHAWKKACPDELNRSLLGCETGLSSYEQLQTEPAFVSFMSVDDLSLSFFTSSVFPNGLATLSIPYKSSVLP